jgi:hypothetical protein
MAHYVIVAGTTAPLRFQLLESGAPINLTNIDVELLLSDRNGTTISSPGTVTVTDAENGKVELSPTGVNVFVSSNSPYTARWKLTDLSSKISYVPTGPRDVWEIVGA